MRREFIALKKRIIKCHTSTLSTRIRFGRSSVPSPTLATRYPRDLLSSRGQARVKVKLLTRSIELPLHVDYCQQTASVIRVAWCWSSVLYKSSNDLELHYLTTDFSFTAGLHHSLAICTKVCCMTLQVASGEGREKRNLRLLAVWSSNYIRLHIHTTQLQRQIEKPYKTHRADVSLLRNAGKSRLKKK